jgi:ABC-2 type transport system permease protein
MRALLVQIKREFWEHRSLWIGPLAVAGLLLLSVALFGRVELNFGDAPRGPAPPAPTAALLPVLVLGWSAPFYLAAALLSGFYLLDCLYGERRDRSILFWKSLPVSDTRTVLVKFLVGLALVPLGSFLLAALTSLLASPALVLRARLHLDDVAAIWNFSCWLRVQGLLLYGLLAAVLWYAPYAAYLMLASGWARHLPSAWALLPPVVLALLEYMIFGTHFVGQAMQRSLGELLALAFQGSPGVVAGVDITGAGVTGAGVTGATIAAGPAAPFGAQLLDSRPDPLHLLGSAQLWLGLLVAAALLALAIRIRRYRDDT